MVQQFITHRCKECGQPLPESRSIIYYEQMKADDCTLWQFLEVVKDWIDHIEGYSLVAMMDTPRSWVAVAARQK